jgi:hypothetical protein
VTDVCTLLALLFAEATERLVFCLCSCPGEELGGDAWDIEGEDMEELNGWGLAWPALAEVEDPPSFGYCESESDPDLPLLEEM